MIDNMIDNICFHGQPVHLEATYSTELPFVLLSDPLLFTRRRLDKELVVWVQHDMLVDVAAGALFDEATGDSRDAGREYGRCREFHVA